MAKSHSHTVQMASRLFTITSPSRTNRILSQFIYELGPLARKLAEDNPDFIKLQDILYVLKTLSSTDEAEERSNQIKFIHHSLWELYNSNAIIKAFVDETLRIFNGEKGKAESFNPLDELLPNNSSGFHFGKWPRKK